jgi:hypothetical protein
MSEDTPLTLSVPEAGKRYFGLSRNGSYDAANRGEIPAIRIVVAGARAGARSDAGSCHQARDMIRNFKINNLAGARQRKCRAAFARDAGKRNLSMKEILLRHRCRNRRCRSKLPTPTDTPQRAFCTPFCFNSFYRSRCVVCERDITTDPLTGKRRTRLDLRKFCGRGCKAEAARFPAIYTWGGPPYRNSPSSVRNAHELGLKTRHKTERPKHSSLHHWAWHPAVVSDLSGPGEIEAHALENAEGNRIAIVRASVSQPGSYYVSFPQSHGTGTEPGKPGVALPALVPLEQAKRRAESFALMAMPLEAVDAKLAAKVKRANSRSHTMGPPLDRDLRSHPGSFKTSLKGRATLATLPNFFGEAREHRTDIATDQGIRRQHVWRILIQPRRRWRGSFRRK